MLLITICVQCFLPITGFVNAISQEPLILIAHDFVYRHLAVWPQIEKAVVVFQ